MKRKTILVLAASRYQLPTIATAKRLGYRVVTTDNSPANPGHVWADKAYAVDTTDKTGVLQIAEAEHVDGVIASCTDVAVPTAAYVSEKLGLPGVPCESAQILCDKPAFRHLLNSHSLPAPENLTLTADYQLEEGFFQDRWIIKPDRSSGSKGVFILNSMANFRARLAESCGFSPTGKAVLERYIEGFQGTCEGILDRGRIALAFFLDRQVVAPPYVATCGHHVPSLLSQTLKNRLLVHLDRILKVLCIADGPFDCDFVATEDEVFILEMTPRMGGNAISNLLSKAAGFDIVEASVRQACGDQVSLPEMPPIRPTAVVLLGVSAEGRLTYDRAALEDLQQEAWLEDLVIDVPIGTPVSPFTDGRHRVGEAYVFGHDRTDVDAKVIELKRSLGLSVLP